jgi:hypothetical protein
MSAKRGNLRGVLPSQVHHRASEHNVPAFRSIGITGDIGLLAAWRLKCFDAGWPAALDWELPARGNPVGMAAVSAWDPCTRRMQGDKGVQVDLELSCSGPSKTDRQCGVHLEGTDRLSDVSALLYDGVGCCGFDGEFYLHTHHRPRNRSDPSTLGRYDLFRGP